MVMNLVLNLHRLVTCIFITDSIERSELHSFPISFFIERLCYSHQRCRVAQMDRISGASTMSTMLSTIGIAQVQFVDEIDIN